MYNVSANIVHSKVVPRNDNDDDIDIRQRRDV
jgi:hypothetical protein